MHDWKRLASPCVAAFTAFAALAACTDLPTDTTQLSPPAAAFTLSGGTPTGKTVVVFRDTSAIPQAGLDLIGLLGGTVTTRWDDVGVAFVTGLSGTALATLAANAAVHSVGNDAIINWLPQTRIGSASQDPSTLSHRDPAATRYYSDGTQWNMRVINASRAWAAGIEGGGARVAILDTGIDYDHRELRGLVDLDASTSFANLITSVAGIGVSAPIEPQLPGDAPYMDNHFHGTHVASTVASNSVSLAGVAPHATLIAVKVLSMTGSGSFESVASGIRHAAGPANASVINMSLGANVDPRAEGVPALLEMMARVIKDAEKRGTIVISAAGNSGLNLDAGFLVSTPCEQSTICVSATGPLLQQNFDQPATYTNYGKTAIEVAAPGGNFVDGDDSAYQSEDLVIGACSRRASSGTTNVCRVNTDVAAFYIWAAGTSMASPHVAGVAALVKSFEPSLSVAGLRARILSSADDVGAKGKDVYTNWGRINVAKALGLE